MQQGVVFLKGCKKDMRVQEKNYNLNYRVQL